jgi:hypothetical protein
MSENGNSNASKGGVSRHLIATAIAIVTGVGSYLSGVNLTNYKVAELQKQVDTIRTKSEAHDGKLEGLALERLNDKLDVNEKFNSIQQKLTELTTLFRTVNNLNEDGTRRGK